MTGSETASYITHHLKLGRSDTMFSGDERIAADEDFQESLVVPQPGRYLPPYASAWTGSADELWNPATMRVMRCYSQAGLDWEHATHDSDRPWVRAPDHLGIECAFIAELTTAAAQSRANEPDPPGPADPGALATSFVIAQHADLGPAYAAQLADHARSRYWRDAADVLATWVRHESLLPPRSAAKPDSHSCAVCVMPRDWSLTGRVRRNWADLRLGRIPDHGRPQIILIVTPSSGRPDELRSAR